MDIQEILTKGFSFLSIRIGGLLMAYVFTYFVTKEYGASVFGLISLCFALFLFSSILGRLGLDINLVRYYASDNKWEDRGLFYRVWLKSVVFSIFLAILLYALKDIVVQEIFKKPQLEPYILWTVLAIPFWTSSLLCASLLRAKKSNNWFAFLNNPGRFSFAVLSFLILVNLTDSPLNAIKAHFYGILALSFLSFYFATRTLRKVSFRTRHNTWLFLRNSFPMMLSSTILIVLGWSDTFILGIYETDENVGIYNVALRIAAFTSFTLQAINSILAPKLAKYHQEEKLLMFKKLIRTTTALNFYITLGVAFSIIVLHRYLLSIFGHEFVQGSRILIILCLGQIINSVSGSVGIILQMIGKQKIYQNIVLLALCLNIVLNILLIPLYGGFGAAISTVVSLASWNIAGAIYLKTKLGIQSYYSPINFKG
ncbi:flippase [Muricauda sp. NFXS6]|uniref:flippase n=1 Tax=Allomuricauda sp. NFXS6 TaxID=2819094 RepID=UPI0032DEE09C